LQRGRHQVFLGQGLQHFLSGLAAANLLPAPPVKSGFIAVDSGHFYLLPFALGVSYLLVKLRAF
jgi:hypothetical protein